MKYDKKGNGIVALIVLCLVMKWIRVKSKKKTLHLPPGSLGLPFVGEGLSFAFQQKYTSFWKQRKQKYGPVYKTHLFGKPCIVFSSVKGAEFVFKNKGNVFSNKWPLGFTRIVDDMSLLFENGDTHKTYRDILRKVLNGKGLKSHMQLMMDNTIKTINEMLLEQKESKFIKFYPHAVKYTLNVGLEIIIGTKNKYMVPDTINKDIETIFAGLFSQNFDIPFSNMRAALQAKERVLKMFYDIYDANIDRSTDDTENDNVLSIAIKTMRETPELNLDREKIVRGILLSMLIAGYRTPANILVWCLYHLAKNQHLQNEMYQAILNGDEDFFSKFFWETNRFTSVSQFTFRNIDQDLVFDGFDIPKGWNAVVPNTFMGRDEELWENPHIFDINRFEKHRHILTSARYMPMFGGGEHRCPGRYDAKQRMTLFLKYLIPKYKISMVKEHIDYNAKGTMELVPELLPLDGLLIKLSER